MASSGLAEWLLYWEWSFFTSAEVCILGQRFGMDVRNFKLAFSGKAVVAKTIPAPQKKAVTSKKAESSSDSDSGNSRNQFLILLC